MHTHSQNGLLILLASTLLMLVLGSVHAFSVFIEPMETRFQASRSAVSLTYSFALGKAQLDIYIRPLGISLTVTNDSKGIQQAVNTIRKYREPLKTP